MEQEVERLLEALGDIAGGHVPPGQMPPLDDVNGFRYKMWLWSQERAKQALEAFPYCNPGRTKGRGCRA